MGGKQACVITADALWILMNAGRAVAQVPGIEDWEKQRLDEATAAAMRAVLDTRNRSKPPAFADMNDCEDEACDHSL